MTPFLYSNSEKIYLIPCMLKDMHIQAFFYEIYMQALPQMYHAGIVNDKWFLLYHLCQILVSSVKVHITAPRQHHAAHQVCPSCGAGASAARCVPGRRVNHVRSTMCVTASRGLQCDCSASYPGGLENVSVSTGSRTYRELTLLFTL